MTTASPRKRGPYAKTAARRRHIIDAAREVFAARGYHGSSLREVSARAEMSLSNLTHHFPTKEDLLVAVLEQRDRDGIEATTTVPAEDFMAEIIQQAQANESVPDLVELYSVLSAESTTVDHPGREYFVQRFAMLRENYAGKFRRMQQEGRLRADVDPALAASALVALWDGIQLQWLLEPDSVDVAAHLRAFEALVTVPRGVAPDSV